MKKVLLRRAIKLNNERKRRNILRKTVQALSAVVVFCTTYALILPAITMEQDRLCGLQAHTHEARCYETTPYYALSCSFADMPEAQVLHGHTDVCYDVDGALRCPLPDRPAHSHGEGCYGDPAIVCGRTEEAAHTHTESCTMENVLVCTLAEDEGHTHSDVCSVTEQILICGYETDAGHTHSDACITTEQVLICGQVETEGHAHTDACTTTEQRCICGIAESETHTHAEGCYETVAVPCALVETPAHSHGETCYETRQVTCPLEEGSGHTHTEACYELREVPCSLEERPAHTHGAGCYEQRSVVCPLAESDGHAHHAGCFGEKRLICEKEELQPHHHDENCYDAKGVMRCTLPELREHSHGSSCLSDTGEVLRKLICTLEAHEHEDVCYADGTGESELEFLCGSGEHTHNETCVDEDGQLLCTIPEHIHSAGCLVADLDLSADMETSDVWDAMFRDAAFSGNWPEDLVTVAQSQAGYRESRRNCVLTEQQLKGYTRYGARYDCPYGDWNTLFVRFCMDYAGIRHYPWQDTAPQWIARLQSQQLFRDADAYTPKPGDLVFLCRNEEALSRENLTREERLLLADHVGIVTVWNPECDGNPAAIRTVEGDVKDRVCNVTYEAQDYRILGYGEMVAGFASEMQYEGEDYTVSVFLSKEAQIPEHAVLSVREILPETEEYASYYQQSVDSLVERSEAQTAEDLTITFARFFDIGFTVGGGLIEPAAPVEVQIRYTQPLVLAEDQTGTAVHFADSGIELLEAELSGSQTAGAAPTEVNGITETSEATESAEFMETTEATEVTEAAEETQATAATQTHVDTFCFTQNSFSVVATVLSNARAIPATVWLDGTCGGLMAYEGSDNSWVTLTNGILPDSWKSPTKYAYVLKGWYDITNGKYYAPGTQVNVNNGTVFYADWVAASYNIGKSNNHTVSSLDTSEFVTTHMFDYNVLFNMQSVRLTNSPSDRNQNKETWTLVELGDGTPTRNGTATLDFVFRDHDGPGTLSRPGIPDDNNTRNEPSNFNYIYSGLYTANLNKLLFDPATQVLGKTYLGQGNYLFRYEDSPDSDYYGYYYYDSSKNAASYNAGEGRFYVYDHTVYAQDTIDNDLHNQNADFLPLNYTAYNGNRIVYASQRNEAPSAMANFNFGMTTNIHFYLPNQSGMTDSNGNYLNKSTTGDPMVFEFSGDDDVWVLLDGKLLLDIGGIHQVRRGVIDFSEGVVRTTRNDSANLNDMVTTRIEDILGAPVSEGGHNLTICYLERGSSMSNCAIYFNLAPRYGLDLTKTDYITGQKLPGVTFQVYNDAACTVPATLWPSHDSAKRNEDPAGYFTTNAEGLAHMWGFVAGKTYYIRETGVPEGYPMADALIRVTLNNHGTDISEVTVIRSGNNTQGFEVTYHTMNKEQHLISLSLTNKRETDPLTALRVEKYWGEGNFAEQPVEVYLTENGQRVGDSVILSTDNAWGYTWMDLPVHDAFGNAIVYSAEEAPLTGYIQEVLDPIPLDSDRISWVKVGALENGAVFLVALDSNNALTAENGRFGATGLVNAESYTSARWTAQAYSEGFRLKNGTGHYLAFSNDSKAFYLTQGDDGNQTFYYDGSQLFVMSGNIRYYAAGVSNGNLNSTTGGDATGLYKQVITKQGTTLFAFRNTPVPEERRRPLMVEKIWEGVLPELPENVLIHVMKDNAIQATLELSPENGWKGTIEDLDNELLENGGYTLEEELPFGFTAAYSEITKQTTDRWENYNSSTLVSGEIYAFITNGRALADENGRPRATTYNIKPTPEQSWRVVQITQSDGSTIQVLRNVATNRYLREEGESQYVHHFTMVDHADQNCRVRLLNHRLQYYPQSDGGGWNITLDGNGYLSTNPGWGANGTGNTFSIRRNDFHEEYYVTVTNTYATYQLPETGGCGTTSYYTFGGLLVLAAAIMYSTQPKRRRQKGGR